MKVEEEQVRAVCRLAPDLVPFAIIGCVAMIAGGLVAAVSRPLSFGHGLWVSAYLVLVVGVAQVGLGAGQVALTSQPVDAGRVRAELVSYQASALLVVVGTLLGSPATVTAGGVLLLGSLVLFMLTATTAGRRSRWRVPYLGLLGLLILSIPVGLTLSWLRQ